MKIEQLLVQYLYNNKKVSLQDIGSFHISPDVILPVDNDKEMVLPPEAIVFEFDRKAVLDEGLVDFIVLQTRKIRPLASSDLESYSILSKQFLNIGKPLIIDGLGTLQKSQQGDYVFTQGQVVNAKLDAIPSQMKEKQSEEISFKSTEKRAGEKTGRSGGILAVVLILLLVAGAAIVYFYFNRKKDVPVATETPVNDTIIPAAVAPVAIVPDSSSLIKKDTSLLPRPSADGTTFMIVFKEYDNKAAADKAYSRYTNFGHKIILSSTDSTHYKLMMPFTSPLSDTLRAKDSLSKFFQSKAYVQL